MIHSTPKSDCNLYSMGFVYNTSESDCISYECDIRQQLPVLSTLYLGGVYTAPTWQKKNQWLAKEKHSGVCTCILEILCYNFAALQSIISECALILTSCA